MQASVARHWAQRWGSHWVSLGDAGHIDAESGFGPLPFAQAWVTGMQQRQERKKRIERASLAEWQFAV